MPPKGFTLIELAIVIAIIAIFAATAIPVYLDYVERQNNPEVAAKSDGLPHGYRVFDVESDRMRCVSKREHGIFCWKIERDD